MAQAIPFIAMGMQAFGSLSSSSAQMAASEENALRAEQGMRLGLLETGQQEEAQRRRSAMQLGAQRAASAQSGIDMTSGSLADLYGQSAINAELDALNIRYGGYKEAAGLAREATQQRYRAAQTRGLAALTAGSAALSSYGSYAGGQGK